MAKVLIASFSQYGSTRKIAGQIALGLESAGCEVTNISISEDQSIDLTPYDVIGIGSPTYFLNPPFIVRDFIRNLKAIENKSFFVFIMYGTVQGSCGNWIRKELNKKGAKDLGYFKACGPDYWLGYIKRGYLFSNISPTAQEMKSAEDFGGVIATRFKDKSGATEEFDHSTPIIYSVERFLVSRPFAKLIYSKTFKTNENCDQCGICIKKCPVNNISENDGRLKWKSDCLLCATCELSCPKDAIHSAFDWGIFSPFMSYNITHSKKSIPYAKVIHQKGKTVPVV